MRPFQITHWILVLLLPVVFCGGSGDRSGEQKLLTAARKGDVAGCVRLVQQEGVSVNTTDRFGMSALSWAVWAPQPQVVQKLIELGADVNAPNHTGITPLMLTGLQHTARRYPPESQPVRNEIAQMLLANGAKPNQRNNSGNTALHYAVRDYNPELIRILLAAGADPTIRSNQGHTPLDIARSSGYGQHPAVIEALTAEQQTKSPR